MTDDLVSRAMAAWFRSAAQTGAIAPQPSNSSYATEHDGKTYVVLENVNGTLAVYRERNDGMLKRLKRWPAEVADGEFDEEDVRDPLETASLDLTAMGAEELTKLERALAAEIPIARDAMIEAQGDAYPEGLMAPDHLDALSRAQDRFRQICDAHNRVVIIMIEALPKRA